MDSLSDDSSDGENKLEITRNPFDSQLYDKDNFPVLDASVFIDNATPKRQSGGEFRWSIDQIAKLKPAQMDLFPNQEYSICYEKKEDEDRYQQQVDEYFKNVLLPSPWLDNRSDILKRVTFSPHPPATRFIPDADENAISSFTSPRQGVKNAYHTSENPHETMLADACCQTMLTFPVNFDLQSLVGKNHYTYMDNSGDAKELMISSLRRKLFGHESKIQLKQRVSPRAMPSYTTSSPTKDSCSSSFGCSDHRSTVSPNLKSLSNASTPSVFGSPDSNNSPKQASNVGTPLHMRNVNISFPSVDVSPIQSCGDYNDDEEDESNYSFLPEVSFDLNETEDEIRESSRNIGFDSPDISPIKNEQAFLSILVADPNTDSLEIQEHCQHSIKESTAQNIHAFTGFDISSINSSRTKDSHDLEEDKGPLDIAELSVVDENESFDHNTTSINIHEQNSNEDEKEEDDDGRKEEGEDGDLKIEELDIATNDAPMNSSQRIIPPETGQKKLIPRPFVSPTYSHVISTDGYTTTPLKGILKHRDDCTPTGHKGMNREENTRYNTVCNSGRILDLSKPLSFTQIKSPASKKENKLPRPVLIGVENRTSVMEESPEDVSPELDGWKSPFNVTNTTISDGVICSKANSVLKRARRFTNSFEREFHDDKENNNPAWSFRRNIQLNSTEITGYSTELGMTSTDNSSVDREKPLDLNFDSGVSSMEWNYNYYEEGKNKRMRKSKIVDSRTSSISPLLRLDQLSLSNRSGHISSPWSGKKQCRSFYLNHTINQPNRYPLHRSYTWPNKERSRTYTPSNCVPPKSRVTTKYRSRRTSLNQKSKSFKIDSFDPIKSAYKDLLPSPLK